MATTLPSRRYGLLISKPGELRMSALEMPQLSPGQVLIKTACVALHPSDAKIVAAGFHRSCLAGLDFAGTVVAVGPGEMPGSVVVVGARVCGVVCGYSEMGGSMGAFADYIVAEAEFLLRVPDAMSFEQASTLPGGLLTAGMTLFNTLRLREKKPEEDRHVLVYGGSTASGMLIIQVLRHFDFKPIATCTPHNFDMVRAAGAVAVHDYHSDDCIAAIRASTGGRLGTAVDCITSADSMRICYEALRNLDAGDELNHARYVALDSFPISGHTRRAVRPSWVFCMTAFGRALDWGAPYKTEARRRDRDFAAAWIKEAEALVGQGKIRPLRVRVVDGSLETAVTEGLDLLRRPGAVSGEKLVCKIDSA
ncbi:hypothetical protein PpBr36_04730 [Pyricularia pennisetigena]|uniref:hypothetical protein n=1 Tax=Pyricularia pennisetigena TaxID=1578925 RepID=UPI0011507F06|nr:hypothetical protein PpBr36_04730 [Pyricularia pennisetigena]TLS27020.1 hypothetical protein PpBr36_04730 [Pyricularia pennisetigena]